METRIKLKKIKVLQSRSEETHCYTASVYFDGVKCAEVGNGGHGAEDDYYPVNPEIASKMQAYIDTLPDHIYEGFGKNPEPWSVPESLESICSEAINEWYYMKDYKKATKSWAYYTGEWDGSYYTIKGAKSKYTRDVIVQYLAKEKTYNLLNDLTFAQYRTLVG